MAESSLLPGEQYATELSQPYWEALREGRLALQQCRSCDRFQHYPRRFCRWCGSEALGWSEVSGRGAVFVSTVAYRLTKEELRDQTPMTITLVRLDEGPMIMACVTSEIARRQLRGLKVQLDPAATIQNGRLTVGSATENASQLPSRPPLAERGD